MTNGPEIEGKEKAERSAEWLLNTKRIVKEIKDGTFDYENETWDDHLFCQSDEDKTEGDKQAMMEFLKEEFGFDPERAEELLEGKYEMPVEGESEPIKLNLFRIDMEKAEGRWFLFRFDYSDGDVGWDIYPEDYIELLEGAGQVERVE